MPTRVSARQFMLLGLLLAASTVFMVRWTPSENQPLVSRVGGVVPRTTLTSDESPAENERRSRLSADRFPERSARPGMGEVLGALSRIPSPKLLDFSLEPFLDNERDPLLQVAHQQMRTTLRILARTYTSEMLNLFKDPSLPDLDRAFLADALVGVREDRVSVALLDALRTGDDSPLRLAVAYCLATSGYLLRAHDYSLFRACAEVAERELLRNQLHYGAVMPSLRILESLLPADPDLGARIVSFAVGSNSVPGTSRPGQREIEAAIGSLRRCPPEARDSHLLTIAERAETADIRTAALRFLVVGPSRELWAANLVAALQVSSWGSILESENQNFLAELRSALQDEAMFVQGGCSGGVRESLIRLVAGLDALGSGPPQAAIQEVANWLSERARLVELDRTRSLLSNPDPQVRAMATQRCDSTCRELESTLTRLLLCDADPGVRKSAASALAMKTNTSSLIQSIGSETDPTVRISVVSSLCRQVSVSPTGANGRSGGIAAICGLLHEDPDSAVRVVALRGLVDLSDAEAESAIRAAASYDDTPSIRHLAESVIALRQLLREPNHAGATALLASITRPSVEGIYDSLDRNRVVGGLAEVLESSDPKMQVDLLNSMEMIDQEETAKTLCRAPSRGWTDQVVERIAASLASVVEHSDNAGLVKSAARTLLGKYASERHSSAMASCVASIGSRLASEANPTLRLELVMLLGNCRIAHAQDLLESTAREDLSPSVRAAAARRIPIRSR